MNILLTTPSYAKHGGIRVIIELANRLSRLGHQVGLYSLWGNDGIEYWNIDSQVKIHTRFNLNRVECLFITSPHTLHLAASPPNGMKIFFHLQMLEHMFDPDNVNWVQRCKNLYKIDYPLFCISKWNLDFLLKNIRRKAETIYIGNGVNTDDFPIEVVENKFNKTVLVEGWEAYNPVKDTARMAPKVAAKLKEDGYKIIAYGQVPLKTYNYVPDEYYLCPPLSKINELYSEATILLKASKYDCRSCSPVEAMTKGTVTCRAIIEGDDDLIHDYNSIRVPYDEYDERPFYNATKNLLTNDSLRAKLIAGCYKHLEENSWDKWVGVINERICR